MFRPAPVLLLQTQPTKLIKNMAGLKYLICCLICHRGPVGLCTCFNLGRSGVQTLLSSTLLAIEKRKGKKRRMKSVPTKDDDILEMRRNCDLITCQYNVGCAQVSCLSPYPPKQITITKKVLNLLNKDKNNSYST